MFDGFAPNFAERSRKAELMDGSNYELDEFIETLGDLRRINRYLGGQTALTRHLFPLIEASGAQRLRLLDVGTGGADIPIRIVEWARQCRIRIEFTVLDLNAIAAGEARAQSSAYPEISVICADAMNLPFADGSFDFVMASLFLHHFETPQAANLITSFARVARHGFLINDLRRHPIAYYSIKVLTRLFTSNRLIRNDSAVSVLRGFTEQDIGEIAAAANIPLEIFRHFPYRFVLIGKTNPQSNHNKFRNHDDHRTSPETF